MNAVEIWSIVSSIVSVILAFFAIFLAIYFFIETKNTERNITSSLTKIETQAESLQKINAKWMDRLTKYVTEERSQPQDSSFPQLIQILAQLPATITATLTQSPDRSTQEQLVEEIYSSYIALYFYTAQTNYWAQFYLPSVTEFDSNDEFQNLIKRMVDLSNADFEHIAGILAKCDQQKLETSPLVHLLKETKEFWRHRVRSTADVFVSQQQNGGNS